jgi:hypothetical protein
VVGSDPGADAERVNADAEHVSRDETELAGMKADNTDNKAVNSGEDETRPALLTDQNCRQNSKTAR